MDVVEARAVLGVAPGDPWPEVRAAFRRLLREIHPDVTRLPDATARTARLTEAYRVVRLAQQPGAAAQPPPTRPTRPARPTAAPVGICSDHGTLLVPGPAEEAFFRLLEVAHDVGEVTYVDPQVGLIESIVQFQGWPVCSLLLTLRRRADGTEALCTIEAIERGAPPPLDAVVLTVAARLAGTAQ